MKRARHAWCGVAAALLLAACHAPEKGPASQKEDAGTVRIHGAVSDTLARQVGGFLQRYYDLKAAFIKSDTALADRAVRVLADYADSVHPAELAGDSVRYGGATAALAGVKAEAAGLEGETSLLEKRREFQMISGITYDLLKHTGLKADTVYRDYCPMFNDGNGAYWLSSSREISNPYYGADMPGCGEVRETIAF